MTVPPHQSHRFLISYSVALKSEIRKLNIVHLFLWVLMAAQVTINLTKQTQTFFILNSVTFFVVFSFSGDSEPIEPGIPQDSSLSIPVGVPLPSEHNSYRLQLLGFASQQHQLHCYLHDQCRTLLCGPTDLRRYGDVPRGAAAVSSWQSVSLYLWFLCRICHVLGDCHCCAGARLADLLQQEAFGPVVHYYTGEEEEMSRTHSVLVC